MTLTALDQQHAPVPPDNIDFSFLPKALLKKCKLFIIRYHELNGFSSLPGLLRHPETSKLVESNFVLSQLLKESTSSRGAKRANEGFVSIATLILSTEILALELSCWARRYPTAHRKAQAVLAEHVPGSRARLTARYLASPRVEGGSTEAAPAGKLERH
jgi:hypothetical protein